MALIIHLSLMKTCLSRLHSLPLLQGLLDKSGPRAGAQVAGAQGFCVGDPEGSGQVALSLSVPSCKIGVIMVFLQSCLVSVYCVLDTGCFKTQDPKEDGGDSPAWRNEQVRSQARGADVQSRGGRRGNKAGRVGWLAEPPSRGGKHDKSWELGPDEMI